MLRVTFPLLLLLTAPAYPQTGSPVAQSDTSNVDQLEEMPVFRTSVVSKTAKAINYQYRSGATKIDFVGTSLMPRARGEAKVKSKKGYTEIRGAVSEPPTRIPVWRGVFDLMSCGRSLPTVEQRIWASFC